jgi:hypothetical protein
VCSGVKKTPHGGGFAKPRVPGAGRSFPGIGSSATGAFKPWRPYVSAMFDTVVVATDGSDSVNRAVDVALDLAEKFDAEIHVLSVIDASEVDA